MNISYNWLKSLIDIDLTTAELTDKLTNVGLAVEGVHAHGDDAVLDIDLTSNRPDCLSHLGVARELRVITRTDLTAETQRRGEAETLPVGSVSGDDSTSSLESNLVTIAETDLCNRFTARIIRNVKIGPSPAWLVDRLEAIGERSINNVADITNYVMHELGQPMHSFDLDKLSGGRIIVRRARAGETITTLDEVDRTFDSTMLAICDEEKPVAIGGVMGGLDSSITNDTVNVLLEVAYFERGNIRATSRKLNLATEASYRFERGVDIENLERASTRATALICELAGGEAGEFVDVYPVKFTPNEIESPDISAAVKRLTGLEVSDDECVRILTALGIAAAEQSKIQNTKSKIYTPPSWRHDLAIEEDLVEEVARHVGYANIAAELPPARGAGEYQANEVREKLMRQTLVDMGFDEAVSYSFIDTRFDDTFQIVPDLEDPAAAERFVTLLDAVIEGAVRMRPSILPGLLDAVRLNFNQQRHDVRLFELGKIFAAKTGETELPAEQEAFAMVITGGDVLEDRGSAARELDFYDVKGSVEAALAAVGITDPEFAAADVKHLRSGQSAAISVAGHRVGYLGRLADVVAAAYKFRQSVYVAEINLERVLAQAVSTVVYRPLSKYPGIVRDVSFAAKRNITLDSIYKAVDELRFELCRKVSFVDIYEGKGLEADERSITIRLEYRSDERTLVEEEVESVHSQIVTGIEHKLGVKQRF